MCNIVLLAETGSDLPKETAQRYGITLVPMHVTFGDVTLDDTTFPVEKICDYYVEHQELPKTSGCSPEDFRVVFNAIHEKFPEKHILHLAYSAVTTCSYQSAIIAAEDRDYVTSIDTKQVSAGQSVILYRTAEMLEKHPGTSVTEAIKLIETFCKQARMSFITEDLEYLKAGGRVSNVVFMGSKLLNIHPAIEIENGYLVAKKKYRGRMERIVVKLLEEFTQKENLVKDHLWLLWSVGLSIEVRLLAENAAQKLGYKKITWIKTGCVITTHGGPGAFGIAGFVE
ncbi:MAG: DegV family protein [Lachnotalea sp.]